MLYTPVAMANRAVRAPLMMAVFHLHKSLTQREQTQELMDQRSISKLL